MEKDIKYKVSYFDAPNEAGGHQTLVLIENGDSYAFVNCPNRRGYWCVGGKDLDEVKENMLKEKVKPVVVSDEGTKTLIDNITSNLPPVKQRPKFLDSMDSYLSELRSSISN